ncbi:MAG TPA: hypothetical protein VMI73_20690 [Trebonia sp.]|nr:hypothetical protein [Trebonia sp.]
MARHRAGGVTVYLVPGLTVRERKAVLRRLRQEGSRGFGPPLPLLALALGLCADKLRTTAGTGAALIRLHPAVTLLPGLFVAAVMTLFVFASAGRPVEFTPGPAVDGLALSRGVDVSQPGGPQAAPATASPLQEAAVHGLRCRDALRPGAQPACRPPASPGTPAIAHRLGPRDLAR